MSGVDERVETVREALERAGTTYVKEGVWPKDVIYADPKEGPALAALDFLAAAVAGLEQRADDAERIVAAARKLDAADDSDDQLLLPVDHPFTLALEELIAALAAAVVSAEPTEEQA